MPGSAGVPVPLMDKIHQYSISDQMSTRSVRLLRSAADKALWLYRSSSMARRSLSCQAKSLTFSGSQWRSRCRRQTDPWRLSPLARHGTGKSSSMRTVISRIAVTDANGYYELAGLTHGLCMLFKNSIQPGYIDSIDRVGTTSGFAVNKSDSVQTAQAFNAFPIFADRQYTRRNRADQCADWLESMRTTLAKCKWSR